MDSNTLGKRIKELRKTLSLKQKDFAELVGMSCGSLSEVENGKRFPPFESFISICGISIEHGITADYLLTGEREMRPTNNTKANNPPSELETLLVKTFRDLPPNEQAEFLRVALNASHQAKVAKEKEIPVYLPKEA